MLSISFHKLPRFWDEKDEARFWDENDVVTLVLAAPKAEPIFWLAEMKLWELEIEDQTEAPLAFADPTASPACLYAWLSCKFFKPCVMSSLNSRHLVMPRRRFKPWACASLEANTWKTNMKLVKITYSIEELGKSYKSGKIFCLFFRY